MEVAEIIELRRIAVDRDVHGAVTFFQEVCCQAYLQALASEALTWICFRMLKSMGIYLDNAAACWPKPEAVYQALERFMSNPAAKTVWAELREGD